LRLYILSVIWKIIKMTNKQDEPIRPPTAECFFPQRPTALSDSSENKVKLTTLASNYFKFDMLANKPVYKYSIKLTPEIPDDSVDLRKKIIRKFRPELSKILPNFIHTNLQIICHTLEEEGVHLKTEVEGVEYDIQLKNTNTMTNLNDPDLVSVYSHLFKQFLYANNFIRIKKKCFDSKKSFTIKEHKLEIWPGFTHSVSTINNQTLLLISPTYKVLRSDTALECLNKLKNNIRSNNMQEFEKEALKLLRGASVVTKYNNDRTYQIVDIEFTKSPMDKFTTKTGETTYIQYFKEKYDKTINEKNQPLLKAQSPFQKNKNKTEEIEYVFLIPELCFMTGLTEEMRQNFQLMGEMNKITKVNAAKKVEECKKSIQAILNTDRCKEIQANWGTINQNPIVFKGKKLQIGNIIMKDSFSADQNYDFSRKIQQPMKSQPEITDCRVIYFII